MLSKNKTTFLSSSFFCVLFYFLFKIFLLFVLFFRKRKMCFAKVVFCFLNKICKSKSKNSVTVNSKKAKKKKKNMLRRHYHHHHQLPLSSSTGLLSLSLHHHQKRFINLPGWQTGTSTRDQRTREQRDQDRRMRQLEKLPRPEVLHDFQYPFEKRVLCDQFFQPPVYATELDTPALFNLYHFFFFLFFFVVIMESTSSTC
jgi:hypothetical protein